MWLRALVSATCVAILVALGWFGWREYTASEERAAQEEMMDCIRQQMKSIEGMSAEVAGLQCAFILASD